MKTLENAAALDLSPAARMGCRPALLPLALALAAVFPAVRAQSPAAPAAPASAPAANKPEPSKLDTVSVTATRRREPASEVPMQVNVIDAENLQRQGAKDLRDFVTTQAGMDIRSDGGPGSGSISIRGVTTGVVTNSTVGVYVDDVAVGSNGSSAGGAARFLDMGLLDLNHIEVLRGPQGTLYGASSIGGVLKYVTNVPDTHDFSGKVSLGGSSTKNGRAGITVAGVVNVPLKEDLAGLRVSAYQDHAGGFVDAVGPLPGRAINRGDTSGARAALLVTPNQQLQLRFTATVQNIKRDGRDYVDYDIATSQPKLGELSHQQSLREPYNMKNALYSAELEYDFGFARLNSITSHQTLSTENVVDASSAFVPLLAQFGINVDTVGIRIPISFHRTSQELRLTSKSDSKFEWLAGLYLDSESGRQTQFAESTAAGAAGPLLANVDIPSTYKEYAAFGDLTWKFDSGFSVTGGLRVAHNKQTYVQNSSGLLVGGAQSIDAASADSSTTYLLTGRYALNTQSSVYARIATGYRPGGPNAVLRDVVTGQFLAPPSFGPDSLISYELGYKANLDNKLKLEAAIYDVEWKDIQQAKAVNGVSVLVNAGKARVRGAEVALDWRPDELWSLRGSAAYIDGRFTEDSPSQGTMAGARLPDTAHFYGSLQLNRNFRVLEHPAYAGATVRYVGQRNAGVQGSTTLTPYTLPAYSLLDLQAGVDAGRFGLALYVRNVLDKRAQLSANTALVPLGGNPGVSVVQPRTFGATLSMTF